MKRLLIYIISFVSFAALVTSCYKDKGNYDYTSVDELKIDTAGLAAQGYPDRISWPVTRPQIGQVISNFEMNVTYGNRSIDNLEYAWLLTPRVYQQVQVGNEWVWPQADTICHTKSLEWTVSGVAADFDYMLRFVAWDPETHVKAYYEFGQTIFSSAASHAGVYVLSEYDGMSDIDVYTTPRGAINQLRGGNSTEVTFKPKLFSELQGYQIEGKPEILITYFNDYIVFTDKTALYLNHATGLQVMATREDMFFEQPEVWAPQALMHMNNGNYISTGNFLGLALINDGKLHSYLAQGGGNPIFSPPLAEVQGRNYRLRSDMAAYCYRTPAFHLTVVFDELNNCFRPYYNAAKSSLGVFQSPSIDTKFNVAAVNGKVMVTMNTSDYYMFTLIEEDKEGGGKQYMLYKLDFYRFQTSESTTFVVGDPVDMSNCPGISEAVFFTSNRYGNGIFYGTETTVYGVSPNASLTATANPVHQCGVGEVITAMRQNWSGGYPGAGYLLWVAVWNEGTQTGTLYEYCVDPTNGKVWTSEELAVHPYASILRAQDPNPYVTTGFGKIKAIACSGQGPF